MKTRLVVLSVVVLMLSVIIGAASAQEGRGPAGRGRVGQGLLGDLVQIITDATGLTPREIRQQIQDGSTLAEVIEANGGVVDEVVAQAVAAVTERINEAVANNHLTQEQADKLLEGLEEHIIDHINNNAPWQMPLGGRFVRWQLVGSVAEATGLSREEVRTQLEGGSSLATILSSNGVDVNGFVDERAAQYQERLNQAVTDGSMSQAVADARLNLFRVELIDWLNRTLQTDAGI